MDIRDSISAQSDLGSRSTRHRPTRGVRHRRAALTACALRTAVAGTLALGFAASAAGAQSPASPASALRDARWAPWVGCWTPQGDTSSSGNSPISIDGRSAARALVCVVPAGGGVDVVSIVDNRVAARERVVADGARVARERDGCQGWESATWSSDGGRLLFASEYTCPNALTRRESGIFSVTANGEWLDAQGVNVAGNMTARVTRFVDASAWSLDSARALLAAAGDSSATRLQRDAGYAVQTARLAAGAPLDLDDVAEASNRVGATVTQAWITEVGQGYTLDARSLTRLADAGVPAPVLDLMIALSHPDKFSVRSSEEVERLGQARDRDDILVGGARSARRGASYGDYARSCLGTGRFGGLYGYGYFPSMFDTGCYGYRGYGYGYGYGYPYGNVYYGSTPVIIIGAPGTVTGKTADPIRAVKGRGYTRGGTAGDGGSRTGSSSPWPASTGSTGASARSSGESSGGASSSGSSGGGASSGGRTAKARGG